VLAKQGSAKRVDPVDRSSGFGQVNIAAMDIGFAGKDRSNDLNQLLNRTAIRA